MIVKLFPVLLAVFFALLGGAGAGAGEPTADKDLAALLEPIRKKHKLPALGGAIVSSKGLLAIAAVGVRKAGTKVAVTVDDQFHIGSDTKAMTAVVIACLVETKRLRWEDTLEKLFPDLKESMAPVMRKVTLLQLMTHHAGLPKNLKGSWFSVAKVGTPRQQREAVVKKALAAAPENKPGEKYAYSNLGYVIAAAAAEKITGASWEELIDKEVFKPLGMKSAGFGPPGTRGKIDQPWPHDKDGDPAEPDSPFSDNPPVMGPAGRVHCSLPDWAKFIADQLKGARGEKALLKPDTYKRLHRSPFRDEFYTPGGWIEVETPRGLVLAHDGSNRFNYASAALIPSKNLAVLVVTNCGSKDAKKACAAAREALGLHATRKRGASK